MPRPVQCFARDDREGRVRCYCGHREWTKMDQRCAECGDSYNLAFDRWQAEQRELAARIPLGDHVLPLPERRPGWRARS